MTLVAGNGLYSLGRVQTPVLAMICQRFDENKSFVPKTFFQLEATFFSQKEFLATSEKRWDSKPEAEKAGAACSLPVGVVKSVQKKSLSEAAPLLHDLTSLQKECNKKLGLTAERTLEFSQALYEGKFITYPRT
ncbi:MAG: DNA topoisomerase, partial [Flammeovirgaceae bacterium]